MFLLPIFLLIVSLYALIEGSSVFVNQSSALARKYKIPEFLIGVTIVAFGTSLPEFIISVFSAIEGNSELTATNVLGSSIANIGFILAVTALFGAIKITKKHLKFDLPISVLGVLIFLALLYFFKGNITWFAGLILLVLFFGYMIVLIRTEKNKANMEIKESNVKVSIPALLGGLLFMVLGGKYAIDSVASLATLLNISQGFIGFTILSIGSSLPELIVSIVALKKGKYGLSFGNIIGSNFFNLFFVIGVSSLIFTVNFQNYIYELIILMMYNLAIIAAALVGKRYYISRREGIFLLLSYIALIVYLYYR